MRPDSLVIRGHSQPLTVTTPEHFDAGARYPLVVDLAGTAAPSANAFLVARTGAPRATAAEIARFMQTKYPIDVGAISIVPPPSPSHRTTGRPRPGGRALTRAAKNAP